MTTWHRATEKKRTFNIIKKTFPFLVLALVACDSSENYYTLYRNSVTDETMRLHVASFDSSDGHAYNMGNCQIARELFQKQDGVKTKFWCEKGKFRK